jgi:signal transduction histidine kinase
MSRSVSVFTRLARRLDHPYPAWVVVRALMLALGWVKLSFWGQWQLSQIFWSLLACVWVLGLAVYPQYRARGVDSWPDDPLDPHWRRPARPSLWQRRWLYLERRRMLPVIEIAGSSLLLLATGGADSPFHEFAQTSLVAPALQYGLRGATRATVYFLLLYGWLLQSHRPLDAIDWVLLCSPVQTACLAALLGLLLTQVRQRALLAEEVSRNYERHRLIQELHDGSAQTQYALSLKLESLAARGTAPDGAAWDRLIYLSRKALLETRQAMVDPDLVMNHKASLAELFSTLTRDFQSVSGIEVTTLLSVQPRLTPSQRVHLFRFCQEALANVFKYAQAQSVTLQLEEIGHCLRLEVADDGVGYRVEQATPGRGWASMEMRAQQLGGRLLRQSSPGEGSRMILEWPRSWAQEATDGARA